MTLGEMVGVDQATISRWERGQTLPDTRMQTRLSHLMRRVPNEEALLKHWLAMAIGEIAVSNQDRVLRAVSPAYSAAHGVPLHEMIGMCSRREYTEESERLWQIIRQNGFFRGDIASATCVSRSHSLSGQSRDIPIRVVWTPLRLSGGEILLRSERTVLSEDQLAAATERNGGPLRIVTMGELAD
jgi:transcriptional regulator with XRE-family HTH domain